MLLHRTISYDNSRSNRANRQIAWHWWLLRFHLYADLGPLRGFLDNIWDAIFV
jgi:hypothetical protein